MIGGSLFSGIGGMDLGLERAGIASVFHVEKDKYRRRVLAKHWPGRLLLNDVTKIEPGQLPIVDVLHGGFPCQDLSVAGRRAGLAGERSGLFFEFVRLARDIRPRWILIENVPGLLTSNDGRDMGTVLGTMADLGYGWAYRVLDAQWFGLAQHRPRVFLAFHLGGWAGPATVLLEPEGGGRHPAPRRTPKEELARPLGANAKGGDRFDLDNDTYVVSKPLVGRDYQDGTVETYVTANLAGAVTSSSKSSGRSVDDDYNIVGVIQDAREFSEGKGQNGLGVRSDGPMYTLDGLSEHAIAYARTHGHLPGEGEDWHEIERAVGLQSTWGAQHDPLIVHSPRHDDDGFVVTEGPADTLTTDNREINLPLIVMEDRPGEVRTSTHAKRINAENDGSSEPMVMGPFGVRRLTMLERERLQGFPDGWTCLCDAKGVSLACKCPDAPRRRAIGDAVAVAVAEWIGRRIAAYEAGQL